MDWISNLLSDVFTGFVSGLFTSAVFVYIMYGQRPKLILSDKVAKTTLGDSTYFSFKVINAGKRDAVTVSAELLLIQPHPVEGGIGYNVIEIPLLRNQLFHLRPVAKVGTRFGGVFEFITDADLEEEWRKFKGSYLLFRVFAQDSLSLFSRVYNSEYARMEETIVVGRFAKGASMEIFPEAAPGQKGDAIPPGP